MRPRHGLGVLILALLLLFLGSPASAGLQGRVPALIPQAILDRLDLEVEQAGKVQAAADAYNEEVVRIRTLATQKEKRAAEKAAREKYDAAIAATLTAEQRTRLASLLEEARQFRTMGPLGARLVGLNLTGEQKARARAAYERHQPEMDRLRASLKGAPDKAAVQAQQRELAAKIEAEVRGVLTPEQQKQFEAAKKE